MGCSRSPCVYGTDGGAVLCGRRSSEYPGSCGGVCIVSSGTSGGGTDSAAGHCAG